MSRLIELSDAFAKRFYSLPPGKQAENFLKRFNLTSITAVPQSDGTTVYLGTVKPGATVTDFIRSTSEFLLEEEPNRKGVMDVPEFTRTSSHRSKRSREYPFPTSPNGRKLPSVTPSVTRDELTGRLICKCNNTSDRDCEHILDVYRAHGDADFWDLDEKSSVLISIPVGRGYATCPIVIQKITGVDGVYTVTSTNEPVKQLLRKNPIVITEEDGAWPVIKWLQREIVSSVSYSSFQELLADSKVVSALHACKSSSHNAASIKRFSQEIRSQGSNTVPYIVANVFTLWAYSSCVPCYGATDFSKDAPDI